MLQGNHVATRHGSKPIDPRPTECSVPGCKIVATIMHEMKPYCGGHALERLEAGLSPKPTAAAEQPDHERGEKHGLERHAIEARPLAEI